MGRSIFQRLLLTYVAVILATIIILAALLTYFSNQRLFQQKQDDLTRAGHSLEALARDYYDKKVTLDELTRTSNALGVSSDSRIYVIDGQKIASLKNRGESPGADNSGDALAEDLKQVLEGKTVTRKKYFSDNLNNVIYVGLPILDGDQVRGVILLVSPLEKINSDLFKIYRIIWGSAAASLFLAALIIYLVSRRISRPIEEMQKAAAAIAEGRFTEDIDNSGQDEVSQLAGTFNYMKNRLAQIEEMRRDLIANVSHELRTPLTSIRGFMQGILDGVVPPEQQEKYLKRAYHETGRLNRLVNDLLQMARMQTGNIALDRKTIALGAILEEITDEFSMQAREKNVSLEVGADAGLTLDADRDKLKQVLLNLVQNALNYTGEGGKICILARVEEGGLAIRVKDNGAGIPASQLSLVFERFHRVEKSRSQNVPGTGLGLSIARDLVELHGGTISVHSEVGRGTEFIIKLPF